MHIGFLTPEYPHEKVQHAAGIGTSVKNLVVALVNAGVQVSVFVYSQNEDLILKENGITLHLIQKKKYKVFTWFFYRKYLQHYLNRFIVSANIDLIEAPDWTGITAFMDLKAPLVIRFHGSDAYFCHLENRKQKRKNFWFEKLGIQKAKAFIAPTTFAGNLTQAIFNIREKPIQTIHYGLQLDRFKNENAENFEKGLVLYIGTIIRKKGVLEFSQIFKKVVAKHPEARLVLIGSDSFDIKTQSVSTWALLQEQLDFSIQDKVTYLGQIPYEQVQAHLKNANVCVFPSFAETLGMVTIESMAMQKAVVNTDIGWAKELIVDSESGFLVSPRNHELFARQILAVLENDSLVSDLGKKANERVKNHFDIEKTVLANINFYKSQL